MLNAQFTPVLVLFSRRTKHFKPITRLSLPFALFNVNEILLFGLPILLVKKLLTLPSRRCSGGGQSIGLVVPPIAINFDKDFLLDSAAVQEFIDRARQHNIQLLHRKVVPPTRELQRGQILLATSIQLCHDLGFSVVAEGVKTTEQMDLVQRCGADVVQGYYLGKTKSDSP